MGWPGRTWDLARHRARTIDARPGPRWLMIRKQPRRPVRPGHEGWGCCVSIFRPPGIIDKAGVKSVSESLEFKKTSRLLGFVEFAKQREQAVCLRHTTEWTDDMAHGSPRTTTAFPFLKHIVLVMTITHFAVVPIASSQSTAAAPAPAPVETTQPTPKVRAFIAELGSRGGRAQAQVAVELGRLGDEAIPAVPDLKKVLARDRGWNLLWAQSPGRYPSGDTSPGREAAKALAKLGEPGHQALLDTLQAANTDARLNAALTLGWELKDPRAIPELMRYINANPFSTMMADAAAAVSTIGKPAIPALTSALRSSVANTRRIALINLARLAPEDSLDLFIAAAGDRDRDVRSEALSGINRTKNPKAIPALEAALKDNDWSIRCSAVFGLKKFDDPEIKVVLESAFMHEKDDLLRRRCYNGD
jgi:HEAT repeat protein